VSEGVEVEREGGRADRAADDEEAAAPPENRRPRAQHEGSCGRENAAREDDLHRGSPLHATLTSAAISEKKRAARIM
jgi:hypothetical protein